MRASVNRREYWAPSFALWIFWACAVVFGVAAGISIAAGAIIDAMVYVFSILVARIIVEGVVVLFDIRAVLVDIRDKSAAREQRAKLDDARRAGPRASSGEMRLDG